MNSLKGQTVVIVGGSSGMGLGAARVAAAHGANVIIASSSLDKLEAALRMINGKCRALQIDITDAKSVRSLFEKVEQLDHLFVTAAPGSTGGFLTQPIEAARSYMEGKFWGSYLCARYAAPCMPEQGSITFLSGGFSRRPVKGTSLVTASQAAVEALGKALAVELAPLRVNTILPGTIDTPLWEHMSESDREKFFKRSAQIPAGRIGQPEDIGHAAVFLMTNSFVTGSVLEVNGGMLLV